MASGLTAGQIAGLGSLFTGMNFVGSIAGSNLSAHKASKLAQLQAALNYKYNKKWALEGAGYNRQGLEAAGYNPMLAVQNGTSGANANFASANTSQDIDFSGDIASGIANAQSFQRLKNETDVATTQALKNSEEATTEQSKRENLSFQNAMLDVEKHLKQKDLDTYDQRFYTQMYEMMQNAEKLRQEASVVGYNAESARIVADAQKLQSETSAKWTPVGIGAGALGFVLGKVSGLKYLKKAKVGFRT